MLALISSILLLPAQAVITRDAYGIPHVQAPTVEAAFEKAGEAVAQDRIQQMDLSRRSSLGRLAEVLGQRGVASDKDALRLGYTPAEYDQLFEALPKFTQQALTAYAKGVNNHIRSQSLSMRAWDTTDSIAIGVNLARRFGRGGAGEIRNLLLYTYLKDRLGADTKKAFDDLLWQNDADSPATAESGGPGPFPPVEPGAWDRHVALLPKVNILELLPAIRIEEQSEMLDLAAELGVPYKWGSYAILVDDKRGTNPILLNGPQMGFSLPSVVHQMSIEAPGYKAIGMDVPGFPGIVVGRTARSAWGATSGVADTDDIFFVQLNPDDPGQYRHKGEWKRFETVQFTIPVKDAASETATREMSVYGPVVLKSTASGVAYVRKSALWMKEPQAFAAILEHTAKGKIDFNKLAAEIPASFNLFGLGDGISWHYCGDVPIRSPKMDPRLPTPGTGEYDWLGILPKAQMPKSVNPKSGFIVNWNNKPVSWWPNSDTPIWGSIFRNTSILKRLPAEGKISASDLEGIIREIAMEDSDAAELIPLLERFPVAGLSGTEDFVYRTIMGWDGMKMDGTAAPLVYPRFYDMLRRELFEPKLGLMLNPQVFFLATQASLTRKALLGETAVDYLAGRTPADVISAAVKRAATSLSSSYGDDTSTWKFSDEGITWAGLRPVPYSNRGTYIQVIQKLGGGLSGRYIAPPGVSENSASKHYADQVVKAANWTLLPMLFRSEVDNRD